MSQPDLPLIDLQCDPPEASPTGSSGSSTNTENVRRLMTQFRSALFDFKEEKEKQDAQLVEDAKTITDLTAQIKYLKRKAAVDAEFYRREKLKHEQQVEDCGKLQQSFDGVLSLLSFAHAENKELEAKLKQLEESAAAGRQDAEMQTEPAAAAVAKDSQTMPAYKNYYQRRQRLFKHRPLKRNAHARIGVIKKIKRT